MHREYMICDGCILSQVCHTALKPEKIQRNGQIIKLEKSKELAYWHCRHSECPEGKEAALNALKSGQMSKFDVVTLDNNYIQIEAVPFGSPHKPTFENQLRIVAKNLIVYSLQNGLYYEVGSVK